MLEMSHRLGMKLNYNIYVGCNIHSTSRPYEGDVVAEVDLIEETSANYGFISKGQGNCKRW